MERLALKYRPRRYEDIIGQSHVTKILTKMHEKNVVPTGLLFQGSRGTGKTTTARIYAMRLNCESADGPCGVCNSCVSITNGSSTSVIEIDAASHGLVEDVRQIKDRSLYAHGGKYRVWLIDEAHSLSRKANDALLKILEEPPIKTVFILVTTEPENIIETVRSRLMPFEFRRVTSLNLVDRLKLVCKVENITAEDAALEAIADFVEGGVRDALTMLEQLSHYSSVIDLNSFYSLYGVVGASSYDKLMMLLFDGKHEEGQQFIVECFARASEGKQFIKGLIRYLTDMLLVKHDVKRHVDMDILNCLDNELIFKMVNMLWTMMVKVRYSTGAVGFAPQVLYCSLVELIGLKGRTVSEKVLVNADVMETFKDLL